MTTLLRIDASARSARSLSRSLADQFFAAWTEKCPRSRIIHRDVGRMPPPAISEDWIAAAFTPEAERADEQHNTLTLSDQLIDELTSANILVIGTPMYNYGLPAALKAWVDQVVRVNRTFTFDLARGDRPLEPVLSGKTLVLLTSTGEFGFGPGGINAGADHLTPHLATLSRYLGVAETHRIAIEYQEFGDKRHAASKAAAEAAVPTLVARLACRAAA